ncbi:MAG TPA: CPBP family intramembrane glutamic endopeptidase [Silvibacterium sp.]|nr:CPBP family intramembrane glutamic endopeptidase [Silvibacterium sp.]
MKVSENPIDAPTTTDVASAGPDWPKPGRAVAPWWHTALFGAIVVGISILSSRQSKTAGFGGSHIKRYAFTIAWECLLALFAWWGLRMRGTPVRQVLGLRRSGMKEWARDFGIALLFWIIAIVVLAATATVLRLVHLIEPQKALLAIAPQTLGQMLLWLALCVTAGVVEEFVFRGYLLQQFTSINGKLWIGVIASSLLFGAAHGYEGIGGMITITVYGVLFCLLAIHRRSLRAGMIAHAWHDSITGIVLAIAKHSHLL